VKSILKTCCDTHIQSSQKSYSKMTDEMQKLMMKINDHFIDAVIFDKVEVLKVLHDCGAKVNACDECGVSALFLSIYQKSFDAFECLLGLGANPNDTNENGQTPLHAAVLLDYDYPYDEHDNFDFVYSLLQHGADIDAPDKNGRTALHLAAMKSYNNKVHYGTNMVLYLPEHGAKIDARDKLGKTPLHLAAERGHLEIVRKLLCGVIVDKVRVAGDVHARDDNGNTALHLAAEEGHTDVVRFLLERGAKIDAVNILDETALHLASEEGHTDMVRFLLERDANIDAVDGIGLTALHLAAEADHATTVCVLLEHLRKQ
jgi:ankyrin repeat protein